MKCDNSSGDMNHDSGGVAMMSSTMVLVLQQQKKKIGGKEADSGGLEVEGSYYIDYRAVLRVSIGK